MNTVPGQVEYEVIALGDGEWGVHVTSAGELPRTEAGFRSRGEAEAWMYAQLEHPDDNEGLPDHL